MFASMLTEDQLAAIGSVAVASTELELTLERFIWELCGFNESKGRIFTDKLFLDAKHGVFKDLIADHFGAGKVPQDFTYLHGNISDLIAKRNTLIHGQWLLPAQIAHSSKPGRLLLSELDLIDGNVVSVRKKKTQKPSPVHAKEAIKTAELIALNNRLLQRLVHEHNLIHPRGIWTFPSKDASQLRKEIQKRSRSA